MQEYSGNEGSLISEEEAKSQIQSYADIHKEDEDFFKYQVFGKSDILTLNESGAVALRIYNGWSNGYAGFIITPIDKGGQELGGKYLALGPICPQVCIPPDDTIK